MTDISDATDFILSQANEFAPADRMIYLIDLYTKIDTGLLHVLNRYTLEDASEAVKQFILETIHSSPIPPDYFQRATDTSIEMFPHHWRSMVTLELVKDLGPKTKAELHSIIKAPFTDEQFEDLYNQVQVWVATHEPRPGGIQ